MKRLLQLSALSLVLLMSGCWTPRSLDPRPPLINDSAFTNHIPILITNELPKTFYQGVE